MRADVDAAGDAEVRRLEKVRKGISVSRIVLFEVNMKAYFQASFEPELFGLIKKNKNRSLFRFSAADAEQTQITCRGLTQKFVGILISHQPDPSRLYLGENPAQTLKKSGKTLDDLSRNSFLPVPPPNVSGGLAWMMPLLIKLADETDQNASNGWKCLGWFLPENQTNEHSLGNPKA